MTRRDLISLGIVPAMLFAVSIALLWLSIQLQHGSERRQAHYAALQRVALLSQSSNTAQPGARSAQTLSSLALADTESAALTVSMAQALASLLCVVALFHVVSLARLARRGWLPAGTACVPAQFTLDPDAHVADPGVPLVSKVSPPLTAAAPRALTRRS